MVEAITNADSLNLEAGAVAHPPGDPIASEERLEELRATGLLDVSSIPMFDGLTALTRRLLQVPVATVSLVGDSFEHFVSYSGPDGHTHDGSRMPLRNSFCKYTVATGEQLLVEDARRSPLLRDSPGISEDGWISYAGAPLQTAAGNVLGTLCVRGTEAREWTADDERVLSELAAIAAAEIDFRVRSSSIVAVEELVEELRDPLELLGDTIHDLCSQAEQGAPMPRILRLAEEARTRFVAVAAFERELQRVRRTECPARQLERSVDLTDAVERAIHSATLDAGPAAVDLSSPAVPLVVEHDPHRMHRALAHLMVAALHHARGPGPLRVRLRGTGSGAVLTVSSRGSAMPARLLAAVVSRLDDALRDDRERPGTAGRCSINLVGVARTAATDRVTASTGPAGTRVVVSFASP